MTPFNARRRGLLASGVVVTAAVHFRTAQASAAQQFAQEVANLPEWLKAFNGEATVSGVQVDGQAVQPFSPPPFPPSPKPPMPPPPRPPPPPAPQTVLGLSYTLLRGSFVSYPVHQGKAIVERGVMSRLGAGYTCNPALSPTAPQTCLSAKYKTLLSVRAAGLLRVLPGDAKKPVQLLLMATGSARVTINGQVVAALTIEGGACWQRGLLFLGCHAHDCDFGTSAAGREPQGPS